ncbi:hypothetical protein [Kitasatospora sp. NPDC093679]
MNDRTWPARLSPKAAKAFTELPGHTQQLVRDLLDIAARTPWGRPQ